MNRLGWNYEEETDVMCNMKAMCNKINSAKAHTYANLNIPPTSLNPNSFISMRENMFTWPKQKLNKSVPTKTVAQYRLLPNLILRDVRATVVLGRVSKILNPRK